MTLVKTLPSSCGCVLNLFEERGRGDQFHSKTTPRIEFYQPNGFNEPNQTMSPQPFLNQLNPENALHSICKPNISTSCSYQTLSASPMNPTPHKKKQPTYPNTTKPAQLTQPIPTCISSKSCASFGDIKDFIDIKSMLAKDWIFLFASSILTTSPS